jgi:hypothetical protein
MVASAIQAGSPLSGCDALCRGFGFGCPLFAADRHVRKNRGVCIKTYRHAEVEYASQKIHRAVYIWFKELEKAGSDLPATIDVYQVKARFPELGP